MQENVLQMKNLFELHIWNTNTYFNTQKYECITWLFGHGQNGGLIPLLLQQQQQKEQKHTTNRNLNKYSLLY